MFDSWYSAGPLADDSWRDHEIQKGHNLEEALKDYAAQHVFEFDKHHLDRATSVVLALPAGVSGHLELGYAIGAGKKGYVLFPESGVPTKLPPNWKWFAGIFEGEGSISSSMARGQHYPRISIGMTNKEVLDRVVEVTQTGQVKGPFSGRKNHLGKKPMYFWQPGKREDIITLCRGMWADLSNRRKEQIIKVFTKCGIGDDLSYQGKPPYEFRWDVMYNFATKVFFNFDDLVKQLQDSSSSHVSADGLMSSREKSGSPF